MNRVYLAWCTFDHEGSDLLGVFSTKKKVDVFLDRIRADMVLELTKDYENAQKQKRIPKQYQFATVEEFLATEMCQRKINAYWEEDLPVDYVEGYEDD